VVKLLLMKGGVDMNFTDFEQEQTQTQTQLLYAAENGYEEVVKQLLTKDGIDVNCVDYHGRTLLWCAAGNVHEAVVKLLMAYVRVIGSGVSQPETA
jgi:ankyrin repeat protein